MNIERPDRSDNDDREGSLSENEVEVAQETARTGQLLDRIFDDIEQFAPHVDRDKMKATSRLLFRSRNKSRSVWVERTEQPLSHPDEGDVLQSFRCEMRLPGNSPASDWIINEVVEGSSSQYHARFFEYDLLQTRQDRHPSDENVKDPSVADLKEAAAIVEESWKLFQDGLHDRILFYSEAKYQPNQSQDAL